MRLTLPLALALLVAAPLVDASWFSKTQITATLPHVGDVLAYAITSTRTGEPTTQEEVIIRVEGTSHAFDRFGIERSVDDYRIDRLVSGTLVWSERCHALQGGVVSVRREVLYGEKREVQTFDLASPEAPIGFSTAATVDSADTIRFYRTQCQGRLGLPGVALTEGEPVPFAAFHDETPNEPDARQTLPPEATTWHGRAALRLHIDTTDLTVAFAPKGADTAGAHGAFDIIIAEGIPGAVWTHGEGTAFGPDGKQNGVHTQTEELIGYAPAAGGAPLAPLTDAYLPERKPDAAFAPRDRLHFDDEAYGFAFRYNDAFDSVASDPRLGVREFLAANPDAFLQFVGYDRSERDPEVPNAETDGGWHLSFCAKVGCVGAMSVRIVTMAPLPVKVIKDHAMGPSAPHVPPIGERTEVASSKSIVSMLSALGVPFKPWARLGYWQGVNDDGRPFGNLVISDISTKEPQAGSEKGASSWVSTIDGGSNGVYFDRVDYSGGLPLALSRPPAPREENAAYVGGIATPGGVGIAVAAAITGAALFVVLINFLPAFYTRLQQRHILDNPARARLYERVRAEPGIHRAELIDFAGVGNGATRHHLKQLARHKLVFETEEGGYARYYATGEVPRDVAHRHSVLQAGSHRRVYELYAREPRVSLRDAGKRLDLSAPSVYRVKRKLEREGLLPAAPTVEERAA